MGRFGDLTKHLMKCIGSEGLICGQWIDVCAKQNCQPTALKEQLIILRNLKTVPLIKFSLVGGANLGGATESEQNALASFADLIGESYQIVDDLIDLTGNSEYSGKDAGLDFKNDRINQASNVNQDRLMESIGKLLVRARTILEEEFSPNEALSALVDFTVYLMKRFSKEIENLEQTYDFKDRYTIQTHQ
jgi:hypothetical protein